MSESLTVDAELLTGGIKCDDLSGLRNYMRRGANRRFPNTDGSRASTQLLLDELDETLTFRVNGLKDWLGATNADPALGLETNLNHYRGLFAPVVIHDIDLAFGGSTFSGEAQTPDYAQQRTGPFTALVIVRFIVPAGVLS